MRNFFILYFLLDCQFLKFVELFFCKIYTSNICCGVKRLRQYTLQSVDIYYWIVVWSYSVWFCNFTCRDLIYILMNLYYSEVWNLLLWICIFINSSNSSSTICKGFIFIFSLTLVTYWVVKDHKIIPIMI